MKYFLSIFVLCFSFNAMSQESTYEPYKEVDGVPTGKSKKKGAYNGEKTKAPVQKDADKNKLPEDFELTTGSKCNVWGKLFAYNTGAVSGVGFRLMGVQVLELAERSDGGDPFEQTKGFKAEDAPEKKKEENVKSSDQETTENLDFDDEIPF